MTKPLNDYIEIIPDHDEENVSFEVYGEAKTAKVVAVGEQNLKWGEVRPGDRVLVKDYLVFRMGEKRLFFADYEKDLVAVLD